MKTITPLFFSLFFALFSATAWAQASPSCEAKAVDRDGKPLSGAAKTSVIKKCQADIRIACEAKAISESGKKLSGAAKAAFVKKCEADAG